MLHHWHSDIHIIAENFSCATSLSASLVRNSLRSKIYSLTHRNLTSITGGYGAFRNVTLYKIIKFGLLNKLLLWLKINLSNIYFYFYLFIYLQ